MTALERGRPRSMSMIWDIIITIHMTAWMGGNEEHGGVEDTALFSGRMMEALTGTGPGLEEEPGFRSGSVDVEVFEMSVCIQRSGIRNIGLIQKHNVGDPWDMDGN